MALLEAQAAGLPVVAGDAGGVGDIVDDGETGLLTSTGEASAFAAAIAMLLADSQRRGAMGARARTTAAQRHSMPAAAETLDKAIRAIGPRGRRS